MRRPPDTLTLRVVDLATAFLRTPAESYLDTETGPVLVFVPPLTAQEQTAYDDILALAKSGMVHLTPVEYAAIRDDLVVIRDLRQLGRNAFMALPDAERFRRLYDAQAATTTILLAILRE